jgi:Zn-dependent peptidase ImmA (M78 family)
MFEEDAHFVRRSSPVGDVRVMRALIGTPEGQELLRQIRKRADDPDEARAVNRYAAALSMPKRLITEEALKIDRRSWPPLYRLAERFEVSITALTVRLKQLNLLYVDHRGRLYESRDQGIGQRSLL